MPSTSNQVIYCLGSKIGIKSFREQECAYVPLFTYYNDHLIFYV
jgi:hypothetical protein